MASSGSPGQARILIVAFPEPPEVAVLNDLPAGARIVGVGRTPEELAGTASPGSR